MNFLVEKGRWNFPNSPVEGCCGVVVRTFFKIFFSVFWVDRKFLVQRRDFLNCLSVSDIFKKCPKIAIYTIKFKCSPFNSTLYISNSNIAYRICCRQPTLFVCVQ